MVHHRLVTRNTLVAALVACSDGTVKGRARRFLRGLSLDELQFIAEFLGACILESSSLESSIPGSSEHVARGWNAVHAYESQMSRASLQGGQEDKILVLREFLGRCGRRPVWSGVSRVG